MFVLVLYCNSIRSYQCCRFVGCVWCEKISMGATIILIFQNILVFLWIAWISSDFSFFFQKMSAFNIFALLAKYSPPIKIWHAVQDPLYTLPPLFPNFSFSPLLLLLNSVKSVTVVAPWTLDNELIIFTIIAY